MGKYQPDAVPVNRRNIARKPALGLEFVVELSPDPTLEQAVIEMPGANSGLITKDPVNQLGLVSLPADLVVVVSGELTGDETGDIVLTLSVTNEDNSVVNAVATFKSPAWVNNQSHKFTEGYATDLVVPSNKKVKAINHVVSITGGGEQGNKLKVIQLPLVTTFAKVGYTTSKDFTTKSRPAIHIPEEEDGSRAIKRGRSKPGELKVTAKHISIADGLARYSGKTCTARAIVKKEQALTTDALYFGNVVFEVDPKAGDGDDHAEQSASGMYEQFLSFSAA